MIKVNGRTIFNKINSLQSEEQGLYEAMELVKDEMSSNTVALKVLKEQHQAKKAELLEAFDTMYVIPTKDDSGNDLF